MIDGHPGDISLAGNIVTTGASNSTGTGSLGGQVDVATLTSGAVSVGNITTSGGAATGAAHNGGNAAPINVTSAGANKSVTLNGTLTALGGTSALATPGNGATVKLIAAGAVSDNSGAGVVKADSLRVSAANSSELSGPRLGKNAISGSIIIIKRLRLSCRTVLGRWSHFS